VPRAGNRHTAEVTGDPCLLTGENGRISARAADGCGEPRWRGLYWI